MKLESSPSIEQFADGMPEPPPDHTGRKKIVRIMLAILGIIIIGLLVKTVIQSDAVQQYSRKGSISGYATDENGNPIQVELFVFGTDIEQLSDENGFFQIDDVPAGDQSIIIAYGLIAVEEKLTVTSGTDSFLGTIIIPTDSQIE
jgi:hypothetical protein